MESKWPYIVGAAIGIIGGALLFHYTTAGDEDEEEKYDELNTDIQEMGTVKRDASGMIVLDDFLKIFKLVTKHSKKQINKFKTKSNETRRNHLKKGEEDEYRD